MPSSQVKFHECKMIIASLPFYSQHHFSFRFSLPEDFSFSLHSGCILSYHGLVVGLFLISHLVSVNLCGNIDHCIHFDRSNRFARNNSTTGDELRTELLNGSLVPVEHEKHFHRGYMSSVQHISNHITSGSHYTVIHEYLVYISLLICVHY